MSRLAAVPDWGDSGSLYQWITILEPGDDGYPMAELPQEDPWAPAINRAIAETEAATRPPGMTAVSRPEYLGWEPDPEVGS